MRWLFREVEVIGGEWPADVPADWLIFNAPRPLLGQIVWIADGPEGRHWAATPVGNSAAVRRNFLDKAVVVRFVSTQEEVTRIRVWADGMRKRYELSAEEFNELTYGQLREMFHGERRAAEAKIQADRGRAWQFRLAVYQWAAQHDLPPDTDFVELAAAFRMMAGWPEENLAAGQNSL